MIRRYNDNISGPLLDRIDLQVQVQSIPGKELVSSREKGESSVDVRARVLAARRLQLERQGKVNGTLLADEVKRYCQIGEDEQQFIATAIERLGLSARAYHRIFKVARTIADLQGDKKMASSHLAEALGYRFFENN